MCGDYNTVIGMDKAEPMRRFITGMSGGRFEPAEGEATLSGLYVETDDRTGKATRGADGARGRAAGGGGALRSGFWLALLDQDRVSVADGAKP